MTDRLLHAVTGDPVTSHGGLRRAVPGGPGRGTGNSAGSRGCGAGEGGGGRHSHGSAGRERRPGHKATRAAPAGTGTWSLSHSREGPEDPMR